MPTKTLGWLGIARFGLAQASLGSIVVLTTTTINRVMVVELSMLAIVPGLLVAWHYGLQVLRPRWGHGSDNGGKRTPWILGGMATLAVGGFLAAVCVARGMSSGRPPLDYVPEPKCRHEQVGISL